MPPQQKDQNNSTWVPKVKDLNLYLGNSSSGLPGVKHAAHNLHWDQQRMWLLCTPENKIIWILCYSA